MMRCYVEVRAVRALSRRVELAPPCRRVRSWGAGDPGFPRDMPGVNQNAPQVKDAINKCQHLMASIGYAAGGYP